MSISLISAISSGAKLITEAEKDAQQKAAEVNAGGAFASALAQVGAKADVTAVSGRPNNVVIPAVLIDAGAEEAAGTSRVQPLTQGDETAEASDATATFLEFASKTPAEKIRAMVLAEMGLTEEALESLDAETRAEIEETIRVRIEARIRQELEEKSGMRISSTLTSAVPL